MAWLLESARKSEVPTPDRLHEGCFKASLLRRAPARGGRTTSKTLGPRGTGVPTAVDSCIRLFCLAALLQGVAPALDTFPVGGGPVALVFDGANIWVGNWDAGAVTKLRPSDGAVLAMFPVAGSSAGLAFDGANIWVAGYGSGVVTKLRASDGAALGAFPVGRYLTGMAFDGVHIWVADHGTGKVFKLRTSDGAVLSESPTGIGPEIVLFDGTNIWTANLYSNTVTKIRPVDGAVLGNFPVGAGPQSLGYDGANIWVSNTGHNTVTKLRASDGVVLGTFAVPGTPDGMAFDGNNMWLAYGGWPCFVAKLRPADGTTLETYSLGSGRPSWVAFDGANIWVANYGSNAVHKIQAVSLVPVSITTSPPGLEVSVDGVSNATPQLHNWLPGTTHNIGTPTPQGAGGSRHLFSSWSDGGAQSHTITVQGPATYTAYFDTQHLLSLAASPSGGGAVLPSPSPPDGFYNANSAVQVTAQANPGYVFTGFTGDLSGSTNPQPVTMAGPRTVTANFSCVYALSASSAPVGSQASTGSVGLTAGAGCQWTASSNDTWITVTSPGSGSGNTTVLFSVAANPSPTPRTGSITIVGQTFTITQAGVPVAVTVATAPPSLAVSVDGQSLIAPQTFQWPAGGTHTIATPSPQGAGATRYLFTSWSDGGAQSHSIMVPQSAVTYTVNFAAQHQLAVAVNPAIGGTVSRTPPSADGFYAASAAVQLAAQPAVGYVFAGWSGALNGTANPQTVQMNAPVSVTATFLPVCGGVTLSSQNFVASAVGGAHSVVVSVEGNCGWTATTAVDWITLSAPSGTGTGTLAFTVAANPGPPARTASIHVAGRLLHVVQLPPTPAQTFTDVPPSHPYFDWISLLRQAAVTSGCTASQYCPDGITTRGQMAVFIIRSVFGGDVFGALTTPQFTDVPATHPYFRHIQKMWELGITTGCTATAYCPDAPVTRGQMAVFVIRAKLRLPPGETFPYFPVPYFGDVEAGHPYFGFVQKMKELGITGGCTASNYCPDQPTTRGQMAVFLIRGFFTP